jgi:cardiolipin synthase
MTIPNAISITRLLLMPIYVVFFLQEHYLFSFIFLVCLALSDYLDGYLARRLNQQSKLGAILDPVADRALILLTYFCGGLTGVIPLYFFILIIMRDVLVGAKMLLSKRVNQVNFAGKFGSWCLMMCAPAFVLAAALTGFGSVFWQGFAFACGIWGVFMYYVAGAEYLLSK